MIAQRKAPPVAAGRGEATKQNKRAQSIAIPPIEKLLPRLDRVKKTGADKWQALCPAHEDKHPSLSIRELPDSTLLLKCWSGCGGADVVEAIGLRLHDLFPRKLENRRPLRPGERWIPRDAMAGVAFEALVVVMAGEAVARGEGLDRAALDRVAQAAGRLRAAAAEVGCG
jgi:hypothetical protein